MSRPRSPGTGWIRGAGVGLLLVSAVPGAAWPQVQSPEALRTMEEAARQYREVHSLCADFEQVIQVRLLGRTVESAGRVCQRRPNLFSMRFTDPEGDLVVSDGEHFWVYYPSLNEDQVMRYAAALSPGRYDFFREFLEDPGVKYGARSEGMEPVGDRECRIVTLTPLGPAAYRRAKLWIDSEAFLIRQLEVHQENGTVRTLTLSNLDLSPSLGDDTFTFEAPEGARVVTPPVGAGG